MSLVSLSANRRTRGRRVAILPAAAAAPAAPAYRSAGATLSVAAGAATVLAPVDSVSGDQLLMFVNGSNNALLPTVSGWTLVTSATKSGIAFVAVYKKTATGAGAANNAAITANASVRTVATMVACSGTTAAVTALCAGFSADAGFAWATNTLTMPVAAHSAGLMVAMAGAVTATSNLGASTYSGGLTEVVDYWTSGGDKYDQSIAHGPTTGAAISPFNVANMGAAAFYTHGIVLRLGDPEPPPPGGIPTYVSSSTRATTASVATVSHTLPTCATGDLIVLNVLALNTSAVAPTTPAGWTVAYTGTFYSSYNYYQRTYWRVKQPGDAATVSITNGPVGGTYAFIQAHAFNGAGSVEAATTYVKDESPPMVIGGGTLTTTGANRLVIDLVSGLNMAGTTILGAPDSGVDANTQNAAGHCGALTTYNAATAGTYGGAYRVQSSGAASNPVLEATTIALIPA